MTTRTYPKRCGKCGQKTMQLATVSYTTTIEHDNRTYRVELPTLSVPQCANCQALSLDEEADRQISAAFRREARLLTPEEIRLGREKLVVRPSSIDRYCAGRKDKEPSPQRQQGRPSWRPNALAGAAGWSYPSIEDGQHTRAFTGAIREPVGGERGDGLALGDGGANSTTRHGSFPSGLSR